MKKMYSHEWNKIVGESSKNKKYVKISKMVVKVKDASGGVQQFSININQKLSKFVLFYTN